MMLKNEEDDFNRAVENLHLLKKRAAKFVSIPGERCFCHNGGSQYFLTFVFDVEPMEYYAFEVERRVEDACQQNKSMAEIPELGSSSKEKEPERFKNYAHWGTS